MKHVEAVTVLLLLPLLSLKASKASARPPKELPQPGTDAGELQFGMAFGCSSCLYLPYPGRKTVLIFSASTFLFAAHLQKKQDGNRMETSRQTLTMDRYGQI